MTSAAAHTPMMSNTSYRFARKRASAACLALLLLGACSSAPKAPPAEPEDTGNYWSFSRLVDTDHSIIALFDPLDLEHHTSDPADWYKYDFAFRDDLAAGRFAAVVTQTPGEHTVRITDSPLTPKEQAVAGPDAELRLRVRHRRLLLSGGNAWPSEERTVNAAMRTGTGTDNWLPMEDGDYKVTITALDSRKSQVHDFVFQLERIDAIEEIAHAPGLPHLVPGAAVAGVAGINAAGVVYQEHCSSVPRRAELSPLLTRSMPLPGGRSDIEISQSLSERGLALQQAGERSDIPLVVARDTGVGTLGTYVLPMRWPQRRGDRNGRLTHYVTGHALCAVRIVDAEPSATGFVVTVTPEPAPQDPLPQALAAELVDRFETWMRVSNEPGARFKSEFVRRARDYRSLVLGIMHYLDFPAREAESLVMLSNHDLANVLLDRMRSSAL